MSVTTETEADPTPAEGAGRPRRPGRILPLQAGAAAAVAGVLLAGGSELSRPAALVALGVVQALLVLGWVFAVPAPGRIGATIIAAAAGGGADAVTTIWPDHGYQPVIGVLGVAIPAMFVHQITRGVVRNRVVESLASTVLVTLASAGMSGVMLLRHQDDGLRWVDAAVLALAAGVLAQSVVDAVLPRPRFDAAVDRGLPGVIVGAVAGAAVGWALLAGRLGFDGLRAAYAGGGTALVACLVTVGTAFALARPTTDPADVPRSAWRWRPVGTGLMTVGLATPVGYLLVSAIGG